MDIAEIAGGGSVLYAARSYSNSKKQQIKSARNRKLERTLNVIKAFEATILQQMENSESNFDNHSRINKRKNLYLNRIGIDTRHNNIPFDQLSKKAQKVIKYDVKFNAVIDTINSLEQWSIYIEQDMVYYKLVFRETHHDYLEFLNEFRDVLRDATSNDDRYSACHHVFNKMKESEQHEKTNSRTK